MRKAKNWAWLTFLRFWPVPVKPASSMTRLRNITSSGLKNLARAGSIYFSLAPRCSSARVRILITSAALPPASSSLFARSVKSMYLLTLALLTDFIPCTISSPQPTPGIRLEGSATTEITPSTIPDATFHAHDSSLITPESARLRASCRPAVHAWKSSPRWMVPRMSRCRSDCSASRSPPTK